MDPLLTRIMLSIVLWPIALVLYCTLFIHLQQQIEPEYAFVWTSVAVGFLISTWMILLWRTQIRWTRRRRWRTFLTIPAASSLGLIVGLVVEWLVPHRATSTFFGTLVALTSWPVMVVLVWRESPEERAQRSMPVSCPACGYDLRGLAECRCPECGRQYTIDGLYAAQPRALLESLGGIPASPGLPSRATDH